MKIQSNTRFPAFANSSENVRAPQAVRGFGYTAGFSSHTQHR